MNFPESMESIISFVQSNPVIVIIIVLGLLFFIYRKPKLFFSLLGLGLVLAGLLYLISTMAGSGSEKKKTLTHEQEQSDSTP